MTKPVRLQLSRRKGFKLVSPNGLLVVKVDRTTKWGNPFKIDRWNNAAVCVEKYRRFVKGNMWSWPTRHDIREALKGKNLACWCKLCKAHAKGKPFDVDCSNCEPCHSNILGRIANA
mgnify:FL=1